MSISMYTGLQGSGKSYEVVSSPILDAVFQGRNVITNVDGIDQDKIHEYLIHKRDAVPDKLGKIIHVTNERVMQPQFFPDEHKPDLETVVKPGDLVAIDEAWRFWARDGGKLSHEHMQFFRMHRHYVNPATAVACDVVLMTQDVVGIHSSLKNVVEFTFRMRKHKALGFTSRYIVQVYEGAKMTKATLVSSFQKKYNPEIFPLYNSYAGGKGKELEVDSRQNIFKNSGVLFIIFLFVVVGVVGFIFLRRFLDPTTHKGVTLSKSGAGTESNQSQLVGASKPVSGDPQNSGVPPFSERWRLAGRYTDKNGRMQTVIVDQAGRIRIESPSVFNAADYTALGFVDGQRVTVWTGADVKSTN